MKKDFELISSMLKEINNKILKKTELESRSSVNKGNNNAEGNLEDNDEDNDNIEGAKLWALNQKQNFAKT